MAFIRITLVVLLSTAAVRAQTFSEWFSQGKTQKKYLLAQIEALNTYSNYLRKGYNVAKGGLGSITSYVGDEFKLHTAYYGRLKTAGPALKNNAQVKEIIAWQQDIIQLTAGWNDVQPTKNALLKDCETQLTELNNVISNKTEMSDAERLQQIDLIHAAMLSNLHFANRFNTQLKIYGLQKQQGINNTNTLKGLYENH
jgi:hypothetical protein